MGPVVSFQKVPKIHFVHFWYMKVLNLRFTQNLLLGQKLDF